MSKKHGVLAVFSGPSGSGKGTVLARAMEKDKNIVISVSVTTRNPREGEVDGVNYYFRTKDEFLKMISENGLIEWAQFCENYYGTPREMVEKCLEEGKNVILEIEVQGAMKVRESYPEAVLIFNLPPSTKVLRERLVGRNTESQEVIEKRLKTAEWELSQAEKYDYVIVNDDLDAAVDEFLAVLKAEKCKTNRNSKLLKEFC